MAVLTTMSCDVQSNDGNQNNNASIKSLLTTFGAVPVGGRNFFRLLQNGEAVLLFPGGVREVCAFCLIFLGLLMQR